MNAQDALGGRGYTLEKLSLADGGMYADLHEETQQQTSDGTTIIAIKYNGGILLGADSRTSSVSRDISAVRMTDLTIFLYSTEHRCRQVLR
jgi:20S proteasome alpha/beta subunit